MDRLPGKKGDNYVSEKKVRNIDFLKIDTEGNEPLVLEGLRGNPRKGNIGVIQLSTVKLLSLPGSCYVTSICYSTTRGMSLTNSTRKSLNLKTTSWTMKTFLVQIM